MGTAGKKYREAKNKVDGEKRYSLEEAIQLLPATTYVRFDESIDVAIRLGIDPKKPDQMVRGTVILPHGTGKKLKVLVFAQGEKEKEARDAGTDYVGGEELVEKISQGWLDFDRAIATPDMMKVVSKVGKILGPRGLMPNPKVGTVTFDVGKAVQDVKSGKVEFKVDKAGILHVSVGKVSFGQEKLRENILTLLDSVLRAKPPSSKGTYVKGLAISTTMGPGIKVDPLTIRNFVKA
ncbi:MAG: 50S ribosomal protein L1 [Deltaproteobacteria bacterium RBG_16_54_18]|jgi:large subunit ribosomal protein L1|nr:MAG: 50S ribosomal protein L1 [Deltaproteobacteria bacterium RBG_16_54_18]